MLNGHNIYIGRIYNKIMKKGVMLGLFLSLVLVGVLVSIFSAGIVSAGGQCASSTSTSNVWIPINMGNYIHRLNASNNGSVLGVYNDGSGLVCDRGQCLPRTVAVDGEGNAWFSQTSWSAGTSTRDYPDYSGGGRKFLKYATDGSYIGEYASLIDYLPGGMSIDKDNNLWVIFENGKFSKYNSDGIRVGNYNAGEEKSLSGLAIDKDNNIWIAVANNTGNYLIKYDSLGTLMKWVGLPISATQARLAVDRTNNIWVATSANDLLKYSSSGNPLGSYSPSLLSGGAFSQIAIDKDNNIWISLYGSASVLKVYNNGIKAGEYDWQGDYSSSAWGVSVDANNHIWVTGYTNNAPGSITQFYSDGTKIATYILNKMPDGSYAFGTSASVIGDMTGGAYDNAFCSDSNTPDFLVNKTYWANLNGPVITSSCLNATVNMMVPGYMIGNKSVSYSVYTPRSLFLGLIKWSSLVESSLTSALWKAGRKADGSLSADTYYFKAKIGGMENQSDNLIVSGNCNAMPIARIILPNNFDPLLLNHSFAVNYLIDFIQASSDADDLLKLTWNFGDGNSAYFNDYSLGFTPLLGNTKHSYSRGGKYYYINLNAKEMERDQSANDRRKIYVFQEGINVVPIISMPPDGVSLGNKTIIEFNASTSFVANCTNYSNPYPCLDTNKQFAPTGNLLKCCYVHAPNTRVYSGNYNITMNWTLTTLGSSDVINVYGDWKTDYSRVIDFREFFPRAGTHIANLDMTYNSP